MRLTCGVTTLSILAPTPQEWPMSGLSRRHLIAALAAASASGSLLARPARASASQAPGNGVNPVFAHGVASGDPLQDRVILWTRVTPRRPEDEIEVRWRVASDPRMRREVCKGSFTTDIRRDFTVKVDVEDLEPGRTYYYRFESRGARSPVGRTRTLPRGRVDAARIAFASCSNYPFGYFNAYARIAQRADLDLVLHLGDYIYEYERANPYRNPRILGQRDSIPENEIITLTDYRLRHAQYKGDVDLQEAHRQHPFVCVWDDHEVANDAWRDGAENHDPQSEGEWSVRRRMAIRAYNEWMPIRSAGLADAVIYRSFRFGDLADLLMLDTRIHGRDLQAAFKGGVAAIPANDPVINDATRTLLGFDQEQWLYARLSESKQRGATWRLLGQQVMMAQLSQTFGNSFLNPDQWDGYRPARERLYSHLRDHYIDNVVVMTGDIHSSWGHDLVSNPWAQGSYDPATGRGVLGVEFVTPAVSSPGPLGEFPDPALLAQLYGGFPLLAPHTRYVEFVRRGYTLLDIDRERVQGEFWHVDTIDQRTGNQVLARALVDEAGKNGLKAASGASSARAAPDPAPDSIED
jgi:alkaline phosphatase D